MNDARAHEGQRLDRARLRHTLRRGLGPDERYALLAHLLESLDDQTVARLARSWIRVDALWTDEPEPALLEQVREFVASAERGDWLEDFHPERHKHTGQPDSTLAFACEYARLIEATLRADAEAPGRDTDQCLLLLAGLYRTIRECDIEVFHVLDDESVDLLVPSTEPLLKAWVPALARSSTAESFAAELQRVLRLTYSRAREALLDLARAIDPPPGSGPSTA